MKFLLFVLCLCAVIYESRCELIALQTKNMFYNMFPIKLRTFEVSVMTDRVAAIALTSEPQHNLDEDYYTINLRNEGKSWIEKSSNNTAGNRSRDFKGSLLSYEQYHTFTIVLDDKDGSIAVKRGVNETILFYKDAEYVKMKYFGVATEEVGAWGIHMTVFDCACCKH